MHVTQNSFLVRLLAQYNVMHLYSLTHNSLKTLVQYIVNVHVATMCYISNSNIAIAKVKIVP